MFKVYHLSKILSNKKRAKARKIRGGIVWQLALYQTIPQMTSVELEFSIQAFQVLHIISVTTGYAHKALIMEGPAVLVGSRKQQ